MEKKLVRHLGFTRRDVTWHTAWSMPAYTSSRQVFLTLLCLSLPVLYLGVGAADWSSTIGELASSFAASGGGAGGVEGA